MAMPPLTDDKAIDAALAYRAAGENKSEAARSLGLPRNTFCNHLKRAAERGLLTGHKVDEGFRLTKISSTPSGEYTQQKPDNGVPFEPTAALAVKGKTSWLRVLPDGQRIAEREVVMERAGAEAQAEAMRVAIEAFKEEIPRAEPIVGPTYVSDDLLNQFVVTDSHFGMLSWREETGADYDLRIAEQLLLDWFAHSIATAPEAHTAVFAQLGDLMHHDALESVTPAHHNVLDADSRLQKVIRVVIRTVRRIIDMLLKKHQHVHVVMASGNHDPASSAWLREMLAAMYENEPRISVDNSPMLYYSYEWGKTALFYHHGHKATMKNVDAKFASIFRGMYGRAEYVYGHTGHRHADEFVKTTLMYLEQHETLAAPDAYGASGPWWSGRSAKRITYSKRFGETGRNTARPEMVLGAAKMQAANDNVKQEAAA